MVDKNKSHKIYNIPSKEDVHESLKWLKDELHITEMRGSKGKWGSSMYSRIARSLRHAYRSKKLIINNP